MIETMKALVKAHAKPGLWLEQVPVPKPGINDVLIRVHKTGICGTDRHIYKWDHWAQQTIPVPMVVGHEFVGEIIQVGANVNDYHPGMLVSGEGHVVCGRCRNCMAGRRHLCAHTSGIGVNRPGAFAQYIVIPNANVWEHAPGIDPDIAAIFDPFGNAVHTALQFNLVGEDVLITGAGPIGIMAGAVARHVGARHVVITDVNPYRLDLARKLGVTRAVNVAQQNLKQVMDELHMTEGFDVAMEMSGSPRALNQIIDHMATGGRIAVLGLSDGALEIDMHKVIHHMLTLRGVYGREMYETWYKMTVFIQSGLKLEPIITHRYGADDFEKGFQAMATGQSGKVVLDWSVFD